MALKLIFIGCNEEQTRRYFKEFVEINKDQVRDYPITRNTATNWVCPTSVWLNDGTFIRRAPSEIHRFDGMCFDQIIVACDRRWINDWPWARKEMLLELVRRRSEKLVSERDRVIYYDLDFPEGL